MFWTVLFTGLFTAVVVYKIWQWVRGLPRVDSLHKKCVFLTGCDSGFGKALARRLDVLGVPVFAGCLTEGGAKGLTDETSERLHTVLVNVTDHESILHAYEFVKANIPEGSGRSLSWALLLYAFSSSSYK